MTASPAEFHLLKIVALDGQRLPEFAVRWVKEYCLAGECQLAYETVLYEIQSNNYSPSDEANDLLKLVAAELGLSQ